jgi:predicted dithiol-disulfide oxidoreductase (DUF899 family)
MQPHAVVSRQEWIAARKEHLAHEKEYTRARERLSEERRALPWVKVDKNYVFDGPDGKVSLAELFKERSQLVVQHVMFAPDWGEACKSCSFWADGFERMIPHLAARDFGASFTPEQIASGATIYNFGTTPFGGEEAPGISVFYRDEAGNIFHTYSCFARGLDMMNAAYHYLDLTPLGRHEEGLPYPMDWVRLRDQYQPSPVQASCCHS